MGRLKDPAAREARYRQLVTDHQETAQPLRVIAARHGVSIALVQIAIRRAGIPGRRAPYHHSAIADRDELIFWRFRVGGWSAEKLALAHKVSVAKVHAIIRRLSPVLLTGALPTEEPINGQQEPGAG